jgi:hypothetical protein
MQWVTEKHGSLAEFIANVEGRTYKYENGDRGWHGTDSVAEAIDIARKGWDEVRPMVDEHRSAIMSKVRQIVDLEFHPTLEIVGAAVDVAEFLTGVPECMIAFPTEERPTAKRTLRLVMDPGANSSVAADRLAHRGAAVATLLEVLQMIGYSLEVFIASPVKNVVRGAIHTPIVQANQAGQHVDVDALMFACGHPAMLRRLIFTERMQHTRDPWEMGSSVPLELSKVGVPDVDMLVQRAEHRSSGEPDAGVDGVGWVLWALQNLGVGV